MRTLVTGANSPIGKMLASALQENGDEVIGIDKVINSNTDLKIIKFDFLKDSIPKIPNIDTCIHLAALVNSDNAKAFFSINVYATHRVLEIAQEAGASKFIYISTGGIYGYRENALTENNQPEPFDIYSLTKLLGERVCKYHERNLKIIILRYFFPYGPLTNRERLINRLIHRIYNRECILLNRGNQPIINPIYISDLIDATVLASKYTKSKYDVFNVAGGECVSIFQLASMISNLLQRDLICKRTAISCKNMIGDTRKIERKLKFESKVSLNQGLEKTIEWYLRSCRR